jgi:vancomycin resistance protein YoaR
LGRIGYSFVRKAVVLYALLAVCLLVVVFTGHVVFWPGTNVMGIDIGLMTPKKAAEILKNKLKWQEVETHLFLGSSSMSLNFAEAGIFPDYSRTVRKARRPLWDFDVQDYPLVLNVDEEVFDKSMEKVADFCREDPVNAKFRVTPEHTVEVIPHSVGRRLDKDGLRRAIVQDGELSAIPDELEIPFVSVEPEIHTEELQEHLPLEVIGVYSTYFADNNDRAHNIRLASEKFQEFIVWPSEIFSFNKTTGPRSAELGYRKAPVIVEGSLIDDYGGGVCQVSSTIYVATLKAGFEIIERHNHGLPISYVPMGLDATVAYDYLDLKMKNPYDTPCLIHCEAYNGTLTVIVFGKPLDTTVWLETTVLKEYPPIIIPSQEETEDGEPRNPKALRSGYLVETVRKFVKDGQVLTVERLNTSMYPPEKPVIR